MGFVPATNESNLEWNWGVKLQCLWFSVVFGFWWQQLMVPPSTQNKWFFSLLVDQFDGAPYRMNCNMEDKISADTDSIAIHYKEETYFLAEFWRFVTWSWLGRIICLHFYNRMSKLPLWVYVNMDQQVCVIWFYLFPQKLWSFGNECHKIINALSGMLYDLELVEEKGASQELNLTLMRWRQQFTSISIDQIVVAHWQDSCTCQRVLCHLRSCQARESWRICLCPYQEV